MKQVHWQRLPLQRSTDSLTTSKFGDGVLVYSVP